MKMYIMLLLLCASCVSYGTEVQDVLRALRSDLAVTVDLYSAATNPKRKALALVKMDEIFYELQEHASNNYAVLGLLLQTNSAAQSSVANEIFALIRAQREPKSYLENFNNEVLCSQLALCLQNSAPGAYFAYARAVLTSPEEGPYPERVRIYDNINAIRFYTSNIYDRQAGEFYFAVATATNNTLRDRTCALACLRRDSAATRALGRNVDIVAIFDQLLPPSADIEQQIEWKKSAVSLGIRRDAMLADLWSIADDSGRHSNTRLRALEALEECAEILQQGNEARARITAKKVPLERGGTSPDMNMSEATGENPGTRNKELPRL
jgi:hypothetical protein